MTKSTKPKQTTITELELEIVLVEQESNQDKIDILHDKIVNSDFESKICEYINLSKKQDKVLKRIKTRKSIQK